MTAIPKPAYAVLARYYDEVYEVWRAFFSVARDEILRVRKVEFASVIDIGCGSGWQSLELARRGKRVLAVDPERAFVDLTALRAREEELDMRVKSGHLEKLPFRGEAPFDLALATFDVLNHLAHRSRLTIALNQVSRVLRPGGHLLFDVNTPETLAAFGEHHRVCRLHDGSLSAETGAYSAEARTGVIWRDWFVRGEQPAAYARYQEVYRQVSWSRAELREALADTGFSIRQFSDSSGWLSFSPHGARWIVLAKKRERLRGKGAP